MSDVHEFMMFGFNEGIAEAEQMRTMMGLDTHLGSCPGLVSREFYRGTDGRWVEHVVWSSLADLEASSRLEDEPAVAALFESFDANSTSYLRGELVPTREHEESVTS